MNTHLEVERKYVSETGRSIYRKTKMDTLVFCEQYVEWLTNQLINNQICKANKEVVLACKWVAELSNEGYSLHDIECVLKDSKQKYESYKKRISELKPKRNK